MTEVPRPDSGHIAPLHGLRGAAAVTVVTGHYGAIKGEPGLGVVLFFILSGFLIGKLYLERPFTAAEVFSYLVARFARVYPLFAVVVLGVGLVNALAPASIFNLTPGRIVPHLLLYGSGMTIWTICTEFHFYFAFVALWWARQRVPDARVIIIPGVVVFGAWALYLASSARMTDVFSYLHIFLLGTLISTFGKNTLERFRPAARYAMPLLVIGYALVYLLARKVHVEREIFVDPAAILVCAGLVFCAIASGSSAVNRLLSIPIAHWLGEISFGIYLFHRPATWVVEQSFGPDPAWVSRALQVGVTLAAAQIAYVVLERPARQAIRARAASLLASGRAPRKS